MPELETNRGKPLQSETGSVGRLSYNEISMQCRPRITIRYQIPMRLLIGHLRFTGNVNGITRLNFTSTLAYRRLRVIDNVPYAFLLSFVEAKFIQLLLKYIIKINIAS